MTPIDPDCYSVRRLSPFQGMLQIIESEQARAFSGDGITWQIQVRCAFPRPQGNGLAGALRVLVSPSGLGPHVQWFERHTEGSGIGLSGVCLPEALQGRRLPPAAFPELPLRETWTDQGTCELVRAYHDWQAPWLLTLPALMPATCTRLEEAAMRRPLLVYKVYRRYPIIIRRDWINRALVEAELRQAVQP